MSDFRKIIIESVSTFNEGSKCPSCNGVGYDLHICPFCDAEGTVGVPLGINETGIAQCKSCGKIIENIRKSTHQQCPSCHGTGKINESSIDNMKNNAEKNDNAIVDNKTGVFEKFTPNQLNALLETLMRNKNSFDAMYTTLANDGFVPLNERSDYSVRRAVLSEMIKDGNFAKQMLQSLVENNQITIQNEGFVNFSGSKSIDDMNREYEKYGNTPIARSERKSALMAEPEPEQDVTDVMGGEETGDEEGLPPADQMSNPEEENPEMTDINPEDVGQTPDDEILDDIKGIGNIGQAKSELDSVTNQMQQNSLKFGELARQAGYPDSQTFGQAISNPNNYGTLSPEVKQVADFYKALIAQQKELQGRKNELKNKVAPPIQTPEFSEFEPMEEAKNMQLRKGIGKSELQLRAGTKGKIFENRLRKLEPYKKSALLEFLENDPKMIDDQDYADMAILTGICEGDLVSMRIEYEETINEASYPVIGGQDVMGQNKKNESKQLSRDLKQASKSQETTEEKVRNMKNQKFDNETANKGIDETDKEDQNRGQAAQVGFLSDQNPANKNKYQQQMNGVYGKRDPKSVKDDANVGNGFVYGSEGVSNIGDDMMKKGEEGEKARQNEPVYDKEEVPTSSSKNRVNEDIDRMKSLFGYNANKYANAKPTNNHNVVFEQQLNNFRLMTESVDMSDRPTTAQLLAMPTVIFEGKETKFDGKNHFDKDGKKVDGTKSTEDVKSDDKNFKSNFTKKEFSVEKLDEGKDTGKKCTECNHKIWEKDGVQKCMCKGTPTHEKDDILEAEKSRMLKIAGVKTEAKHQQLKHTKGLQIKSGTQEELVDEAKNLQLKHTKGHQIEAGTKKEDNK